MGIIPSPGNCLIEVDFSGIEVCISCCYHKDPKMIRYVKHPEKNNMHTDMAKQIFMLDDFKKEGSEAILRNGAKNGFVFPEFYGDYYVKNALNLAKWGELPQHGRFAKNDGLKLMTGVHLGEHFINNGMPEYDDFENHIQEVEYDFWNNRFKRYGKWKEEGVKEYFKKGFLTMKTGFTCSGLMDKNKINNYPIQGSAFHCNLKSFIKVNRELKIREMCSKLIGQIHDSMIFDANPKEVPQLMDMIKWIACEWLPKEWKWIIVPMEVEAEVLATDAHWASKPDQKFVLRAA